MLSKIKKQSVKFITNKIIDIEMINEVANSVKTKAYEFGLDDKADDIINKGKEIIDQTPIPTIIKQIEKAVRFYNKIIMLLKIIIGITLTFTVIGFINGRVGLIILCTVITILSSFILFKLYLFKKKILLTLSPFI